MSKRKPINPFDSLDTENYGWKEIYLELKELFISSFTWDGLPPSVNPRYLELMLFECGQVAFFEDEVLGYLALQAINAGNLDVFYEPIRVRAYGGNGYQNLLENHKTCALIYNNNVRNTPAYRVRQFARRIHRVEITKDINVNAQKTPMIIKVDKKQELSLKNVYKQYDGNQPVIFVDKSFDDNSFKVIKTDAPYVVDKLEEEKRKLWSEALSFIGIENNYSEKRERLTKDEVLVANGLAIANRNAKLQARERAVEEINRLFGLNVSVKVNNLSFLEVDKEGDEFE